MSAPAVNIKATSALTKETEAYISEMMQNFADHFPKLKVTYEVCGKDVIKFYANINTNDVLPSEAVTKFQQAYNLRSFLYSDGDKTCLVFNSHTPMSVFPKVTFVGFTLFLVALATVVLCGSVMYQGVDNTPIVNSIFGAARFDLDHPQKPQDAPEGTKKTNPYATKDKKAAPASPKNKKKDTDERNKKNDAESGDQEEDENEGKKPQETRKQPAAAQKDPAPSSKKKKDAGTEKPKPVKKQAEPVRAVEDEESEEATEDKDDDSYHKVEHEEETEL
jgi:hypothetical protein